MKPDVSVVIPTFRRPEGIRRAINSVLVQDGVKAMVEIIVMDNDPDASARGIVATLDNAPRWPIVYGHEPNPGVANARNAALSLARGRLIAFLDDDETACDGWLAGLLDTQEKFNADLVFGPVRGRLIKNAPHKDYIEARFTREGPAQSCLISTYYGCGNSLLKRAKFFNDPPLFDNATNEIGGEDDMLFSKALNDGARIAWAATASVNEDIPPDRATLKFSLSKAFAFGQGPSQTCWQHRDIAGLAFWMLAGLGQVGVYGLGAAFMWALGMDGRASMLDKAAQGLGKALWFKGLEPRFYGDALL